MDILFDLFILFAKLSLFSFGGGFVMIPIALQEFESKGLASASQSTDIVAIATMSPGPVGVNLAVGMGYKVASIPGVIASFLGMTLPTLIIVILVALFFMKIYDHPLTKAAFYGLRPVITGVIIYAGVSLAIKNGILFSEAGQMIHHGYNIMAGGLHLFELKSVLLVAVIFLVLLKTKIPPVVIIVVSGILGVWLF